MSATFVGSISLMALKPLLLHLTRQSGEGLALPAAHFQLAAEVVKVAICVCMLLRSTLLGQPALVWRGWRHTAPFMRPAAVYLLMNILTVRAARLLPPPTFQLLANTKILFTAIVARALMSRRLTTLQWLALVILTVGVAMGQWRGGADEDSGGVSSTPPLGVLIMLINSGLSALGGVCTEQVLKSKESANLSIFATNIHMAAHTLLFNSAVIAAQFASSQERTLQVQLPVAYEAVALLNEAMNGIVISLLMRRFDSIAKNYAFSASVFATAGLSAVVLDHRPAWSFYVGALLTFASMVLFAWGAPPGPSKKDK